MLNFYLIIGEGKIVTQYAENLPDSLTAMKLNLDLLNPLLPSEIEFIN